MKNLLICIFIHNSEFNFLFYLRKIQFLIFYKLLKISNNFQLKFDK